MRQRTLREDLYGKISQITKTNGGVTTVIKYTYDATGNRIGKWVQVGAGTPRQTAYVRDASGNVMAIYEKGNSEVNGGLLSQIEVSLYGSSRLGVWRPDREVETTGWELFDTDPMTGTGGGIAGGWERGRVQFELSNHLGNVLVTISDARTAVDDGTYEVFTICHTCLPGIPCVPCFNEYDKQNSTPDGVVDYYLPQILSANDYYPFGMGMPGRKFAEGNYRYGFNGQEKSTEIDPNGNSMTAEFWQYDARIGRRWNVDPVYKAYESSYGTFAGNPLWFSDFNGADTSIVDSPSGNNYLDDQGIGTGYQKKKTLSSGENWRTYFIKDKGGKRFIIKEVSYLATLHNDLKYWRTDLYYWSERPLAKESDLRYTEDAHWVAYKDDNGTAASQMIELANTTGTAITKFAMYAPTFFAGGGSFGLVTKGWSWRAAIEGGGQMIANGGDIKKLDIADMVFSSTLTAGGSAAFGGAVDWKPFESDGRGLRIVGFNKNMSSALTDFGFKYAFGGNGLQGAVTNSILKNSGSRAYSQAQETTIKILTQTNISVPGKALRVAFKTNLGF